MEIISTHQVLIIGAGPSGLALALSLQQNGVDYLILEQSDKAGSTWAQMPDHLSLISLWHSNCLTKEDLPLSDRNKAHKAIDFSHYLEEFAKKHCLKIEYTKKVMDVSKTDSTFVIATENGTYKSFFVVDCRGYFNFPFIPKLQIEGTPPLILHFKDYKNVAQLKDYKKVLIVGKRLSAGQLLRELSHSGKHQLFLSARSEITYSSKPLIYNFFLRNLGLIEGMIKKLKIKTKEEIEVPMEYGAKKIVEEKVAVKGNILKIENKIVYFTDGSHEEIDVIIFATGFRPKAIDLKNDFESAETEGLFYLGRSGQRSFTSRFLRGIREDAPALCQLILERLPLSIKAE